MTSLLIWGSVVVLGLLWLMRRSSNKGRGR